MVTDSQALDVLHKYYPKTLPQTAVILGSGWNEMLQDAIIEAEIPYDILFGANPSVPGHQGKLVIATINQTPIVGMVGRFHMYEGYTAQEVTLPIRLLHHGGIKQLILTAASGAINEHFQVGDLIVLNDMLTIHLSLMGPLVGPEFVDLSDAFSLRLRTAAAKILCELDYPFHEGVYMYLHGPNYETPADKMACKALGADVVGMSTVPETIMARALGIEVLGLSLVTNLAFVKHAHEDVVAAAMDRSRQLKQVLTGIINTID